MLLTSGGAAASTLGADTRHPQYQALKGRVHQELLNRLNLDRLAQVRREDAEPELRGVISTNALELGIDVGSLDASILVGFPNTIASTWQQAGRAGRSNDPALAVVVA